MTRAKKADDPIEKNISVLIVEDHPEQAQLMELILKRTEKPFSVKIVHDANSGLKLLEREEYDSIVLDYNLPGMNGIKALQHIKRKRLPIPVIMVTGQGDERIAVEAMRLGAYDYIVKTRDYLDLLPRVIIRAINEKKLSSKLKQSEQRYFALFDKASIAIFIAAASDYRLLQVNKSATELMGIQSSDLLSKTFIDLCSSRFRNEVKSFLKDIKIHGQASSDQISLVASDRSLIPSDISASQVEIGERKVIQLFVRDISEKVKMQKQLLLSRQRLISLFDGITDLISVQDRDHHLIMGNKKYAQFASSKTDKLVGEKCYKALFDREKECENCPADATYQTGKSKFVEIFDEGRTFHIWTYPMAGLDGKPEFLVEYVKNVTEQKEIEKQLIKSEKLASIGLLSSGIAHELRNPLNIIETARYSLQESLQTEEENVVKRLNMINKNVRRASVIIDNLLQFSKHSTFEKERIIVEKLLDSTLSLLQKEIALRNINIIKEFNNDYKVFFSLDSLKQVFLNIILNSIQAMPNGGNLKIVTSLSQNKQWVLIKCNDTGVGISEENLKHIFTPFFTTKRHKGGTGLGLYLSYTIIKKEGGDIMVKSREGSGTTFIIKLPVAKPRDIPVDNQTNNY